MMMLLTMATEVVDLRGTAAMLPSPPLLITLVLAVGAAWFLCSEWRDRLGLMCLLLFIMSIAMMAAS